MNYKQKQLRKELKEYLESKQVKIGYIPTDTIRISKVIDLILKDNNVSKIRYEFAKENY